jgi:hypothetical protein
MRRELGWKVIEVEISGPAAETELARTVVSRAVEVVKRRVVASEGLRSGDEDTPGTRRSCHFC